MRRYLSWLAAVVIAVTARPATAGILSISPTGTAGPGGSILFSEITPGDPTSAYLNLGFTAIAPIDVTLTVTDDSPIATYGSSVNSVVPPTKWGGFEVSIISGTATFLDLNNINDPYGTYNDQGLTVSLANNGLTAVFSGGVISSGSSLDQNIGLSVTSGSVTLAFIPVAAAVPEPSGLCLGATAMAVAGGLWLRRRRPLAFALPLVAIAGMATPSVRAAGPSVVPAYQGQLTITSVGTVAGHPTQIAWNPSTGLLYIMTTDQGPISFNYSAATGALTNPVQAAPQVTGIGIGFLGTYMYLTSFDGTIHKLSDDNGNGIWGEPGELDVAIVTGLPQGDHNTDQIQITGNTLYVGIGRRTINGHSGAWTSGQLDDFGGEGFFNGGIGRTWGDSAYNGTISWIQDLTAVSNQTGSANAFNTEPPVLSQSLIQQDSGPFTNQGPGKLVVHSAGTRNPFGLCLDSNGNLYFTNNFNRTVTLGNGQAGFGLRGDTLDSVVTTQDVHDQLFKAVQGADYGYTDVNWRGVNPMLTPGAAGYNRVIGITFDNLFNQGPYNTPYDPANPVGLGPSSSADGCSFWYSPGLPNPLLGNIFITRYNGTITEAPPGTRSLTYSDIVAVDVSTGTVQQVATGFANPLVVFADNMNGRLLIADYGDQQVYSLSIK
jgi:hypothetical protein